MSQVPSFLPSALILSALLVVAVIIVRRRAGIDREAARSARFALVAAAAVAAQAAHFAEELVRDFAVEFPAIFGLEPLGNSLFVGFNVAWLGAWILAIFGVRAGATVALVPLWFLGLAAVLNSVAHPALAAGVGGYFPGLLTVPLVSLAGIALLSELSRITRNPST